MPWLRWRPVDLTNLQSVYSHATHKTGYFFGSAGVSFCWISTFPFM